jgi:site-specific DNA recombinase
MPVALYARVSTPQQHQEGPMASQVHSLKHSIHQQGWRLLADHESLDEGISGARLDRPALDRLRDGAQRGEFEAVVVLSPDRLARNYAHQWLLIEEFTQLHTHVIFLQNPFGDTPQGKLRTQMQGMSAEYERAQILERTRRGRLEKARRGELIPWAYRCYGYRYLPTRHGSPPQVMIEPGEADVVRRIYRMWVEEHRRGRHMTKPLNESHTPPPSGLNQVWHPATVRTLLTNRVYAGQARDHSRQPVTPRYRKRDVAPLHALKTGRRYRPDTEWVWSDAPAIISSEWFEKAQVPWPRNAVLAHKLYQPTSRRYLLRRLVTCGECGLGMVCNRQQSVCKTYE